MLDVAGLALRDELIGRFARGADATLDDAEFHELARRVFEYNLQHVAAYAAYVGARGVTPGSLNHWTRIPAVPTGAFKEVTLVAEGATPEAVFRTSGTTRGAERRGEHHVPDLTLYRASLRSAFQRFLLPDDAQLRFLSLMPSTGELPGSSLAFMISDVTDAFGAEGSATFADLNGLHDLDLDEAVDAARAEHRPVLLLGTSAAFVHWLDRLAEQGRRHSLPEGSRLMDTGGYKGKGRRVDPGQLRAEYGNRLGIPEHACINEYGMTEMLSQLYDDALLRHSAGEPAPCGDRRKRGPGWVRSVAVDPDTLEPLPAGATGLLRHLDLANLGSVAAIQTEDLGRVDPQGLVLEGRAAGAVPRGCSLAMDLLLQAEDEV